MKRKFLFVLILGMNFITDANAQEIDTTDFENREVFNLGKTINSEYFEGFPMIMPDGLTLYFSSDRPGGSGDLDIFISQRETVDDDWGEPVNLEVINSPASDHSVTVSADGQNIYFMSKRDGSYGSGDIYISYRNDVIDAFGWGKPENLGPIINTEQLEACPLVQVNDNGKTILYFVSNRDDIGGMGEIDIYSSVFNEESGMFDIPVNMSGINSQELDMHFEPVKGLIWSNRPGGLGDEDIWKASFDTTDQTWKNPVPLSYPVNTGYIEGMPSLTHDLKELIFHSNRPGGEGSHDIYVARKQTNE